MLATARGLMLHDLSVIRVIRVEYLGGASAFTAFPLRLQSTARLVALTAHVRPSPVHYSGRGASPRRALLAGPLPAQLFLNAASGSR